MDESYVVQALFAGNWIAYVTAPTRDQAQRAVAMRQAKFPRWTYRIVKRTEEVVDTYPPREREEANAEA